MRILLVNDYSTPAGGAEIYCLRLRDLLCAQGHDARLFASGAGLRNQRRADYECFGTMAPALNRFTQTWNPSAARQLKSILSEFRPDVVQLNIFLTQVSPSILKVLQGTPTVYMAHWYRTICPTGKKYKPDGTICSSDAGAVCHQSGCIPRTFWPLYKRQLRYVRQLLPRTAVLLSVSRHVREVLRAGGVETSSILPYFFEIPESVARPSQAPPVVLFAGRLVPEKGALVLLEAMKLVASRIPEARLLIAGEGAQRGLLVKRIRELGLSSCVEFHGFTEHERMFDLLQSARVLALPSLWPEPVGLIAIEAMAAGIPVVASAAGGLPEVVEHGRSGYLVQPGSAAELADRLCIFLEQPDVADAMGAYGRKLARTRHDSLRYLQQLIRWYEIAMGYDLHAAENAEASLPVPV